MDPSLTGRKYDKIARWWHEQHQHSHYGLTQLERAISYCKSSGTALDVGCGSGGRMIRTLEEHHFTVTGVDASAEMIALARSQHPGLDFHNDDILAWQPTATFDLILAWDSIFHLPLEQHAPVLSKLCRLLNKQGILMYTFGDDLGEHLSEWRGDTFYYSTLGINANLKLMMENGCETRHLELDQFPEKHVCLIAQKM